MSPWDDKDREQMRRNNRNQLIQVSACAVLVITFVLFVYFMTQPG